MVVKKIGVHLGILVGMCLALYLGHNAFSFLGSEPMRLLAAMTLGAYAVKPLADWIWDKLK